MVTRRVAIGDEPSTFSLGEGGEKAIELALRVVGDDFFAMHALPRSGTVVIGRTQDATVRIDDTSVSRRHAAIHLGGAEMLAEDLGSANGTRVRGRVLREGERAAIVCGDVLELGSVLVIVQAVPARAAGDASRRELAATMPPPPASARVLAEDDDPMAQVRRLVERVALGTLTVLLIGETGVGKEVTAELVHRISPRRDRPFLRLNCAALSETLLESELFGHERGAFTGAVASKPGLLEIADGGTVFLDEVGELPPGLQAKLLRVIEDRRVLRVGGLAPRQVDVRFVAATNRDLEEEVVRGAFRRDLFFRLNGISIVIPPLRQRVAEIEPLVRAFGSDAAERAGYAHAPELSPDALALLRGHVWPGNIRELRNVIERAVLLSAGGVVRPEHLALQSSRPNTAMPPPLPPEDPPPLTEDDDKQRVLDALARCAGNQTQAAKLLGISRSTLVTRLDAYNLPRPRKR